MFIAPPEKKLIVPPEKDLVTVTPLITAVALSALANKEGGNELQASPSVPTFSCSLRSIVQLPFCILVITTSVVCEIVLWKVAVPPVRETV